MVFLITGLNLPKKKITQFINSKTSEKAHSNKCNNMETKCHVMNKNLENRYWGKAKAPLDHNVYHVSSPRPSMKWVQFHQQSILLQEHINYQPDQNIIANQKIELMAPVLPNIFNHNKWDMQCSWVERERFYSVKREVQQQQQLTRMKWCYHWFNAFCFSQEFVVQSSPFWLGCDV